MKITARTLPTHNPWGEAYWASGLRENLTSRSYGEGLETGRIVVQVPRQSLTRQNEQFNVQKNHGYELEHNYGHGQQTLSMVFYLLNLLAFLAHKLLEFGDRLYQQCRTGESRRGLWTLFRSAFYLLAFDTWDALLRYHLRETVAGP